jgi:penicillin-binding protein 2
MVMILLSAYYTVNQSRGLFYNPLVSSAPKHIRQPRTGLLSRWSPHSPHARILPVLFLIILTACTDFLHTPVPSSTIVPTDYPASAGTVVTFVDAINQQDYTSAFNLLDQSSQAELQDADHLKLAYTNAQLTAGATQVNYELRGGLLAKGDQATTLLVATWQTPLLGSFNTSSTLTMTWQTDSWRVAWTRDLIVPGLADGVLSLRRNTPQRGSIYASDGSALAVLAQGFTIGIRRQDIKDSAQEAEMLAILSQMTGQSQAQIKARYADQPEDWFVPIANLDADTVAQYSDALSQFKAVSAEPHYTRSYPQGTLAPHVVGYVGPIPPDQVDSYKQRGFTGDESIGLSGVEGYMDDVLAGTPGGELQVIGSDGTVHIVASRPFTPSRDVALTISPTLQLSAQGLLGSRRGALIVMVPSSGAILAMASYPTFDDSVVGQSSDQAALQQLMNDSAKPLLNRAIQGTYPPGSTFKMVTMSAGMGEGITNPADVFNDPGYWDGLGRAYRKTCWLKSGHGRITLQDGLTASCDVVFYTVGKRLDDKGSNLLSEYGKRYRFGMPTGVELSAESAGLLPDPDWKLKSIGEAWTSGDTVNMAIGQGYMLATPLQIAQMTAAIANNGSMIRPHAVAEIEARDPLPAEIMTGTEVTTLPVTQEGLQAIQQGMVGVINNARIGTTYFRFSNFDYYIVDGNVVPGKSLTNSQRAAAKKLVVAGKSGTAQAPGPTDEPFAWFTAYVPADDPQIVVTALLENAGEGSTVAAPLVRQMIESYYGLSVSATPKDSQVTD